MSYPSSKSKLFDYPLPGPEDLPCSQNQSRDLLLKLDHIPSGAKPIYTNQAITRTYKTRRNSSETPLQDIQHKCQKSIDEYKVELPYSNQNKTQRKLSISTPTKTRKVSRGIKRSRGGSEEPKQEPRNKTPIPNKTIFFSPSQNTNKVQQSTPISFLKEATLNHKRSNHSLNRKKSIKLDLASEDKENVSFNEDEDPLACHAENIMRMAVDSTMLSSYSGSFSSTFADDSVLGHRKKYDNILDDDADRSVLESIKKKWGNTLLAKLKATRIDINDEDLKQAVGDVSSYE